MAARLRERRGDIALLTKAFADEVCRQFQKTLSWVSPDLIVVFEQSSWPENLCHLEQEVERAVALTFAVEPISRSTDGLSNDDDLCVFTRSHELETRLILDV